MILGQSMPSAALLTDCYTVPVDRTAVVRIIAANRTAVSSIRVSLAKAGAADTGAQYVVFDLALSSNRAIASDPVVLQAGDVVRVYSNTGSVSFTVDGIEE